MKKSLAFILLLIFVLPLTGCQLLFDEEPHNEISEIIEESDVQLKVKAYHHIQEVNIEYINGDTCKLVYSYPEAANAFWKDYIGCVVFENGQQVRSEEYIRDEKDNIISIISEDSATTYTLTYDENDNITKKVITVDGIEQGHEAYIYNTQEQLTETAIYQNGSLMQRMATEYDERGRRTKITRYDGAENVTSYDICEFDQNKYKEKVMQYQTDGTLIGYQINFYDLYDLVLIEEAYDINDNLVSTTTRKYSSGEITYDAAKGLPNT